MTLQDLVPRLVDAVRKGSGNTGVLICGTGVGVEIGANRFTGIRASLCTSPELAAWAREYDNANVLCPSGWQTSVDHVPAILDAWLSTEFDGDEARQGRLGVHLLIDTNTIDNESDAMVLLRRLHLDGWINLQRCDVMDTELASADPGKLDGLLDLSAQYPEYLGPVVGDDHRPGHSVRASPDDDARLNTVFGTLFPGASWETTTMIDRRYARHIATAIRYAQTGFVTSDQGLLKRAAAMHAQLDSFLVLAPREALGLVAKRLRSQERRESAQRRQAEGAGDVETQPS